MAIPLGITKIPAYGNSLPYGGCGQPERKPTRTVDELLGRKLSPTPSHLTRAVYIPYHRNNSANLALYNVTDTYKAAIGKALVGSSEYKMKLCLMRKPTANTLNADVRFLVNAADRRITVRERCLGGGEGAQVLLPPHSEESFSIQTDQDDEYLISTTYALPAKATKGTLIDFPYFSIQSLDDKGYVDLEWQIHPIEQGGLCYTLIDNRLMKKLSDRDEATMAIYHHSGMEQDIPRKYSEGMLLLPENPGLVDDVVIVASLLGLLRKIRSQQQEIKKSRSFLGKLGRIFCKSSAGSGVTSGMV